MDKTSTGLTIVKAKTWVSLVFDIRRPWYFKSSRNVEDALSAGIAGNIFMFWSVIIICTSICILQIYFNLVFLDLFPHRVKTFDLHFILYFVRDITLNKLRLRFKVRLFSLIFSIKPCCF